MRRITGILIGFLMAFLSIFFYDACLDRQIVENKEAVRNHRTYERFWSRDAADLMIEDNTLTVFGSSELRPLGDYEAEVGSFLNGEEMNIMTVGAGNFQSLSHAITLGAIADGMENKTAALFVSPQWFSPEGVPSDAYAARFSEDELLGFLENGRISGDSKNYVLDRSEALLAESPVQLERVKRYADAYHNKWSICRPYTMIMSGFWKIKAKNSVVKQIKDMGKDLPAYDLEHMDWDGVYQLAKEQGEAACTNNDFGIYDEYWDTYVKETYEAGEIQEKQQVYTESVEYGDLRCFLDVSQELDIHVLLVSIPVNEKWYSYQGMLCDEYYEKIRSISGEYENVELVDMTEYGSEKYFLKDIMHLGWKGWARINEELYKRFTD